jgi:hypothetical protein
METHLPSICYGDQIDGGSVGFLRCGKDKDVLLHIHTIICHKYALFLVAKHSRQVLQRNLRYSLRWLLTADYAIGTTKGLQTPDDGTRPPIGDKLRATEGTGRYLC